MAIPTKKKIHLTRGVYNCTQKMSMKYNTREDSLLLAEAVMESSEYSPNRCVFRNDDIGVWLYQADCIEFIDKLIAAYPLGVFDMIFADPPYFLLNGGITCHAGKMVKVDKGQ